MNFDDYGHHNAELGMYLSFTIMTVQEFKNPFKNWKSKVGIVSVLLMMSYEKQVLNVLPTAYTYIPVICAALFFILFISYKKEELKAKKFYLAFSGILFILALVLLEVGNYLKENQSSE